MSSADRILIDSLNRQLRERADAVAYESAGQVLTFADVDRASNRIANGLVALGAKPGDRIACLTKHHLEALLLTLGACKLGAVMMPVNWRLALREVEYILGHGEAVFLMVDDQFAPLAPPEALPTVRHTVSTKGGFADWYEGFEPTFAAVEAAPDDAALQLYSSGTTGLPKGVVLTHSGLISTSTVVAAEWGIDPDSVNANALPVFHIAGMTMLTVSLHVGCRTVTFPDFDPLGFARSIGEHRITHAFLVPAMIMLMLQTPGVAECDFSSLKIIAYGGSPISDSVLRKAIEVFGCQFMQVYGLTETTGPVTFLFPRDHADEALLRSAGQPIGGARLRIVDPATMTDVPDGEVGEVWIECDRNFKEYWRNPAATEEAFPEGRNANGGWFRSGDAGYLEDGRLYIQDRIKDMIISGGENIYPAEIENVLMEHPEIADAAIIAVPDTLWGEAVKACIVPKPGAAPAPDDIIAFTRERLARYKCPKTVDFVEVLPRNPSGKILKRLLREPYWKDRDRAVN
jgi:acyl-CoA synthetase (AMP-forming)/AMP-acid ligase II